MDQEHYEEEAFNAWLLQTGDDPHYDVVYDTYEDPAFEAAIGAALVLTAKDWDNIESGMPVSKRVPSCFQLNVRVKVDTDGVVWFEKVRISNG